MHKEGGIEREMTKFIDDIAIPLTPGGLRKTVGTVERVSKVFGMSIGKAKDKTAVLNHHLLSK